MPTPQVYLIPVPLAPGALHTLPAEVLPALQQCSVLFVEDERSARRFCKLLWPQMVIDSFEWVAIHKAEEAAISRFNAVLKEGKTCGIISEAGCPGVADPGQLLVQAAQQAGAVVKPLTGPSSVLLALMASGLNGQQFCFHGYLPVDAAERKKKIKALEAESRRTGATQIFIETPYRNNQLFETLVQSCEAHTRLCIAVNISGEGESIRTQTISGWKKQAPQLHKIPVIFLLCA
ncbi:MAG: SAM-dependent methyltransferase [Dinghuibacter sp.]|nr:SAM-dependent methyltransferase [Dinghuibacter sp.]